MFALSSSKRILVTAVVAAGLGAIPYMVSAQDSDSDDPPPEAGRISYISGNVSIQPVSPASTIRLNNYPSHRPWYRSTQ